MDGSRMSGWSRTPPGSFEAGEASPFASFETHRADRLPRDVQRMKQTAFQDSPTLQNGPSIGVFRAQPSRQERPPFFKHKRLRWLCVLACFVWGCQPSWKLRKTAPEGVFSPQSRFQLDALRYSPSLRIDDIPAGDFFRKQRKFRRDRWRILVRWLNYDFQRALLQHSKMPISPLPLPPSQTASNTASAPALLLRPVVTAFRLGQTHIQLSLPSQITIRLQVLQHNRVIEEAEFKHQSSAEIIVNPEVRLRKDAYGLGKLIASYLDRRMRGLGPPDDET